MEVIARRRGKHSRLDRVSGTMDVLPGAEFVAPSRTVVWVLLKIVVRDADAVSWIGFGDVFPFGILVGAGVVVKM